MRKKIINGICIGILLTAIILESSIPNVNASTEEEIEIVAMTDADDWIDEKTGEISFPIDADSEEWKNFDTHDEMVEACTIPDEILAEISTADLVDLVLDYPLLIDMFSFDTYEMGMEVISKNFNGMCELLSREGAAQLLLDAYCEKAVLSESSLEGETGKEILEEFESGDKTEAMEMLMNSVEIFDEVLSDAEEIMKLDALEVMLGQEDIIDVLNDSELDRLSDEVIDKYIEKSNIDLYDGNESVFSEVIQENELYTTVEIPDKSIEEVLKTSDSPEKVQASSSYVYVYTKHGSAVQCIAFTASEDFSSTYKITLNTDYKNTYPKATFLSTATRRYNCHSYAWYSRSTSNVYWMNNPNKYISDGSRKKVGSSSTANGQILLIGSTVHSAVTVDYKNNIVKSKWGSGPLMQHATSYGPALYSNAPYSWVYYE